MNTAGYQTNTIRFQMTGLHNPVDVNDLEAVVNTISGVASFQYQDGTLQVEYDPLYTTAHVIQFVIEGAGYPVQGVA